MNPTAENPPLLLSTAQKRELRKIARSSESQNPKRVLRALALLHLHEGRTVAEVASTILMCEKTVRNLRRAFRERGLDTLGSCPDPGNRSSLRKSMLPSWPFSSAPILVLPAPTA